MVVLVRAHLGDFRRPPFDSFWLFPFQVSGKKSEPGTEYFARHGSLV